MLFTSQHLYHYRALLSLGLPIVVGQVGNIILGFADTLMVGHHSMQELAAASFVNNMFMLFVVFSVGFSYGLTPIIGTHYGKGETHLVAPALRDGLAVNTLFALLLMLLQVLFYLFIGHMGQPEELLPLMRPYLLVNILSMPFVCWGNTMRQFFDALGDTRVSMFVLLGGNVLNIVGNYLLIYGVYGFPELGLLGAGISTAVSRMAMALAFFVFFLRARRYRVYSHRFFSSGITRAGFVRFNAMGWPLGLQLVMETASFSLATLIVGWLGTTALAAHQVMLTVSQLFYMVYTGLASAVAIRVSHFYGQRDYESLRLAAASGFRLVLVVACIVAVPVFLMRHTVSFWFTDSVEVSQLVGQTIFLLILLQMGDGLQCIYANTLRGISCVKPLMRIAFLAYFVISLPLSWLLGIHFGFGLQGVWSAFPVSLLFAGVLYYTTFRRRLRGEIG